MVWRSSPRKRKSNWGLAYNKPLFFSETEQVPQEATMEIKKIDGRKIFRNGIMRRQ